MNIFFQYVDIKYSRYQFSISIDDTRSLDQFDEECIHCAKSLMEWI